MSIFFFHKIWWRFSTARTGSSVLCQFANGFFFCCRKKKKREIFAMRSHQRKKKSHRTWSKTLCRLSILMYWLQMGTMREKKLTLWYVKLVKSIFINWNLCVWCTHFSCWSFINIMRGSDHCLMGMETCFTFSLFHINVLFFFFIVVFIDFVGFFFVCTTQIIVFVCICEQTTKIIKIFTFSAP